MYLVPDAQFWWWAVIFPVLVIVGSIGWLVVEVRRLRKAMDRARLR
jgi:ABC-type dipeptide/oligopeptide/nickel transport system permease subunit